MNSLFIVTGHKTEEHHHSQHSERFLYDDNQYESAQSKHDELEDRGYYKVTTTAGTEINGFVFSAIGDLLITPHNVSLPLLESTLTALHEQKSYICASRIQHLINAIEMPWQSHESGALK
ncbi:hypothetical protein ACPV5O_20840 [Vibrio maritimus]|uniref:hypothetical protein n=1 Tax=Vibrio maritimus TaxID=990268 RepID=UPI0040680472